MLGQFLVTAVQQRFITTGTDDAGFEIVGNGDPADALKKGPSMAVSGNPSGQLFVLKRFDIGLIAGPQHRHKQVSC